jgi:hypothetical protein
MHDKYRKRRRGARVDDRLRRQIATEAARRLLSRVAHAEAVAPTAGAPPSEITPSEYAAAKRMAVAVLGHRVREGDLPSDEEVRGQLTALARSSTTGLDPSDEAREPAPAARLADHLDRFAIFRMRLGPLHGVKLNSRSHPEGDALYHALQVFERAREVRPYDEEFLLAALLHEVGRAIDFDTPIPAALHALEGTITPRTVWLIEHLREMPPHAGRVPSPRTVQDLRRSEHFEDLALLAELDLAGRAPGARVGTVDEALTYLRALEDETTPAAAEGDA